MTIYDNYPQYDHDSTEVDVTSATVQTRRLMDQENVRYVSADIANRGTCTAAMSEDTSTTAILEERDDGDPAELVSGGSDAKKRPLSVSSTSSSSTSSLPRHQRKKLAGATTSPIATNSGLLQNPLTVDGCLNDRTGSNVAECDTSKDVMDMDLGSEEEDDHLPGVRSVSDYGIVNAKEDNCAKDVTVSSEQSTCDQFRVSETNCASSQPSVPGDNNNLDLKQSYIDKVATEILETERTYVRDLNEIIQVSENLP